MIFIASNNLVELVKSTLQENLGSNPPLPSVTPRKYPSLSTASQYLAILYNSQTFIWLSSIYPPSPYLLLVKISYNIQAGLSVQPTLNFPFQSPRYILFLDL